MKEADALKHIFKPVLHKDGQELDFGPGVVSFLKPSTDKWWKGLSCDYQDPDFIRSGSWEWGYKCTICGEFFKLTDSEEYRDYKCFPHLFGELSGKNHARELRIAIHSNARNNAVVPALTVASKGICSAMYMTERKAGTVQKLLSHAQLHGKEAEQLRREKIIRDFESFYEHVKGLAVNRCDVVETDDAYIIKDAFRGYTVILKKDAVAGVEKMGDTFYRELCIKFVADYKARLSKSGKSIVVEVR